MLRCCQSSFRTCVGHGSRGAYPQCSTSHNPQGSALRRHSTLRHALTRQSLHTYLSDTPTTAIFESKRNISTHSPRGDEGKGQALGQKPVANLIAKASGKLWTPPRERHGHHSELMAKVASIRDGKVRCDTKVMDGIISLYRSRQSAKLSGEDMDDLIAVCGTWCLPEDSPRSSFMSAVLRGRPPELCVLEPYWKFVSELQEDKKRAVGNLSIADEYWQMQKAIFRAQLSHSECPTRATPNLKELDSMYRQSRHRFTDAGFHLAFFETAFIFPSTSHRVMLLLCDYIQSKGPLKEVLVVLWRLILQPTLKPSSRLQEKLIRLVASIISGDVHPPNELQVSLVLAVFPLPITTQTTTQPYLLQLARAAFDPGVPLAQRWDNLQLLAMTMSTASRATPVQIHKVGICTHSRGWRTLLFLAYFRTTLKQLNLSTNGLTSLTPSVQAVLKSLWDTWLSVSEASPPPTDVDRTILATFVEVAGWLVDETHVRRCFEHSWKRNLHWTQTTQEQVPVADLFATYAVSLARCRAYTWDVVFPHLQAAVPDDIWIQVLARAALKLMAHGAERVRGFTTFLESRDIVLPTQVSVKLATSLVSGHEWSAALPLLSDTRFSPTQIETLAISFLRVFQVQRTETIPSSLALRLANALLRIYMEHTPSPEAKFPVRYFLKLMIAVGQGAKALELIKHISRNDRTFFTQHVVRRYTMHLVAKRNSFEAVRLLLMFQNIFNSAEVADLNRKVSLGLYAAGSTNHATRTLQAFKSPLRFQTPRERMMKGALLRKYSRTRTAYLQVMHVANRVTPGSSSYIPAIRFALSFLVKHQRLFAARKLYARAWPNLDRKTHALFGNMILHGCYGLGLNLKRLRKHLVHTMTILRDSYGFKPDRATVNIIAKVVIHGCPKKDSRPLRALLDEFVRKGYPASGRALGQRKVPFGTPEGSEFASQRDDIPWPNDSHTIVFRKHVQPLYKMFITAFYLRKDVAGAKTVLAMLKDSKYEMVLELEKRNAARREGIVRKKAKLARLAVQNTASS